MATAVTTYEWLLAPHILAAVIWVGGAMIVQLFAWRAVSSGDPQRVATFAGDAEWIGMRIFLPASLLLVFFGFLLIGEGSWGYPAWIVIAIAIWIASFLTGALFLGPESGRINKLSEEHGADSEIVQARLRRIFLVSRIELVFLLLLVLDMVLKPGA